MFDIFNIPVYYISFNYEPKLEKNLSEVGFKKITHFKAIDGRKFSLNSLLKEKIISIRSYNDILTIREQHSGMPSLGAIGCTMSHYELWRLCVEKNLPYIAVAESDLHLNKINPIIQDKIKKILERPNSVFISAHITRKKNTHFLGTHFYIISNSACKELIKNAFPIDVQTDAYIAHMDTIKKINLEGFSIGSQKRHTSLIQNWCIKCLLPTNIWTYILITLLSLTIIVLLIIVYKLLRRCKSKLNVCLNTPPNERIKFK
jgi:GR25 family glycosyltransferase involved in LPS biosynthesis